ncbi:cupin domain protein [Meredithblackwellia eburnea MCA 4105]
MTTNIPNDLPPIRRIVTSHDSEGEAKIWINEEVERKLVLKNDDVTFGLAWVTNQSPADISEEVDGITLPVGELTNEKGSVVRYVDMPPHHVSPMHRTTSIDYGFVLFGEIELELSDGSFTVVKPGEIVVQRGTDHAWHNKTDKWARMVYVLLPSEPLVINGKVLGDKSIHT